MRELNEKCVFEYSMRWKEFRPRKSLELGHRGNPILEPNEHQIYEVVDQPHQINVRRSINVNNNEIIRASSRAVRTRTLQLSRLITFKYEIHYGRMMRLKRQILHN